MTSESCGISGQEVGNIVPCDENCDDRRRHNVSVQTGKEFSEEFLRKSVTPRKANIELHDLLGIKRRDSDCSTEFPDYTPRLAHAAEGEKNTYFDTTSRCNEEYNVSGRQPSWFSDEKNRDILESPHVPEGEKNTYLESCANGKMRLLCSYGGRILPRPNDGKLRYVGGETRIISIKKNLTFNELVNKTTAICNQPHTIKYQLPEEDLDALVSVLSDEDLQHMIEEYHDLQSEADYQYVVAVNGMLEPGHCRSSSRDTFGNALDYSPICQRDFPTSLPFDNHNRGNSMNVKFLLRNPSSSYVNLSQVPSTSYVQSSPLSPAAFQIKDPNRSHVFLYDHVASLEVPDAGSPYTIEEPLYENSYHVDTTGYYYNCPLDRTNYPSKQFVSYTQFGRTELDSKRLMSNKTAMHLEKFNFSQVSDIQATSGFSMHRDVTESRLAERPNVSAEESISQARERNREYLDPPSDKCSRSSEVNTTNIPTVNAMEHKLKLPKILCYPESASDPQILGERHTSQNTMSNVTDSYRFYKPQPSILKDSSGLQNMHSVPFSSEESSFYLDWKNPLTSDISLPNSATDVAYTHEVSVRQKLADGPHKTMEKGNADGISAASTLPEIAVIVEDVTDSVPPDIPLSSTVIPHVQDEPSDGIPSAEEETDAESVVEESDYDVKIGSNGKEESVSDAAIIEKEAGIYGLQIIRNSDLEELQELGSGTYERLIKEFWREAKILSKLHHPNIVALYGVVPDGPGGTVATLTEYMINGSLRHVLARKDCSCRALDLRKKLMLALDAAFGMEYLHLKNIVHFDLKCENLLVNLGDTQRPVYKVGDFGLSRIKRNTLVSGGVRGTLTWMAPELLNGNSSRVSEKVDVFSFGITMWEILTGEEPYANLHCGAIIGGIVNNTLRPPVPQRCDSEWRKLMEECWSPDPEARPSFTQITNRLRAMTQALQPKT
ncbi:serinethreonine-protein kinase ctr1 [Nicotiana attenuata]|uniref:Serinethreonine-protein kinase ctr1 n=1 Tax=Nicotiana attenuata TaxID=49451 RepID=A0A1J6JDJ2_NICAT|nr:serinethreonine-protein kinase ctr1 [Nicotiana attenuata]